MLGITRGGTYFRVFKPDWDDPLDTSFSREIGGRWNAPGLFGALYLNATRTVAAANARAQHRGRAIGLLDLRPERRPRLLQVHVPRCTVLDAVRPEGLRAVNLPANYPWRVGPERCRPIGLRAYRRGDLRGIASRSAAECSATDWLGEELAWFDKSPSLRESGPRRDFELWYPDAIP
ncbi:MAG: RES domain-containing protein [Candidatus Baltobacteraceae bacterium]